MDRQTFVEMRSSRNRKRRTDHLFTCCSQGEETIFHSVLIGDESDRHGVRQAPYWSIGEMRILAYPQHQVVWASISCKVTIESNKFSILPLCVHFF